MSKKFEYDPIGEVAKSLEMSIRDLLRCGVRGELEICVETYELRVDFGYLIKDTEYETTEYGDDVSVPIEIPMDASDEYGPEIVNGPMPIPP